MSLLNHSQCHISTLTGIGYALPVVPVTILMSSNSVLSGIYATHHGLPLTTISLVMLIATLFDAVTDPSIGYLSDRYHARTGSRRPFIVGGAVLLIPCAWFLLNPGEGVTTAYFLIWYLLFYLALTLFQIPHLTWGGGISPIAEQKNRVYAYRSYGSFAGMAIFSIIPMLPFTEGSKVTPETMRYLVVVAAVILLPTLYMMLRYVPTGVHRVDNTRVLENPLLAMRELITNKPLQWFIAVSVAYTLASAFYIGLLFIVTDSYLGLGEYFVYLMLFNLVLSILTIKPAVVFITSVGKINAFLISALLTAIAFLILLLVLLNTAYTLPLFVLFFTVYGFSSALVNVVVFSLLSDVSDYATLKSGIDRSATCFSLQSFSMKTFTALGVSASVGLAGLWGFDPTALSQEGDLYWVLAVCMGVIPVVLALIAALCIPKIAINEQRHAIIRKRLDARAERLESKHKNPVADDIKSIDFVVQ